MKLPTQRTRQTNEFNMLNCLVCLFEWGGIVVIKRALLVSESKHFMMRDFGHGIGIAQKVKEVAILMENEEEGFVIDRRIEGIKTQQYWKKLTRCIGIRDNKECRK